MSLTYSVDKFEMIGNSRRVTGTLTFDSSYVTGGEPVSLTALGLYMMTDLAVRPAGLDATHAYVASWDGNQLSPKVKLFQGDNPNAAAAQLIEVPNATNVAAVVARFEARGK